MPPRKPTGRFPLRWAFAAIAPIFACLIQWDVSALAENVSIYQKRDSWARTMVASRRAYLDWRQSHGIEIEPWYVSASLLAPDFATVLDPERHVDLRDRTEDGTPLWERREDLLDGGAYRPRGLKDSALFLYRIIQASAAVTLDVKIGSDRNIAVWLNGALLHSKTLLPDDPGTPVGIPLSLRAGKNELLVKIYSKRKGRDFNCTLLPDRLRPLWTSICRDFPVSSKRFETDTPDESHLPWFLSSQSTTLEEDLIRRTLDDIGPGQETLANRYRSLVTNQISAGDPAWLELYDEAATVLARLQAGRLRLALIDFEALRRAVADLENSYPETYTGARTLLSRLDQLEARVPGIRMELEEGRLEALLKVEALAAVQRETLVNNPLLDFEELRVVKRGEEQLGLPQNWQGNCALPPDGYDNEITAISLRSGRELRTVFRPSLGEFVGDVDLHFDAGRLLFSMPDPEDGSRWQVWELQTDGSGMRRLTPANEPFVNNYDACYLPDGRIIFSSTRCLQGVPCVGGNNNVANLCIMNADGSGIRQLCFDQDHNWCPTVLNDGRVLYTRWEYSDTPHYFTRILFQMNPDGTGQREYYGSNSYWPNSMFYARPIPGDPSKVVTIVSGHHGVPRMGELVILDPSRGRFEANGVVQRIPGYGKTVEPVIVDQLVNDSWPKFLHPYPLSEKYFLAACQPAPEASWGIYLVDIFDNLLPLAEAPGYALFEPLPFRKTVRPPSIPDRVRLAEKEATVLMSDVYAGPGLRGVPRGSVKALRVFEFHYAYPEMGGHDKVGVEGPWDVHRILGTVPVEADGSASFRVPANTPLAVQPLDAEGRALQLMRSWFTAMPGEVVSCVGCHEKQNTSPPSRSTLASRRRPERITPWHGRARGFGFKREIQPVLDRYCVGCHDGETASGSENTPDFRAREKNGWENFTSAYLALHPFVRRPGPESDYHMLAPLEYHASTSELVQMLEKGHHGVELDAEAMDRLSTWIDLNVPDHGTWADHEAIPQDFDRRRLAMRACYAGVSENPEAIPAQTPETVAFEAPGEPPKPDPGDAECAGWPFGRQKARRMQQSAGEKTRRVLDLGDGLSLELALVPAGTFLMGSTDGNRDEAPVSRTEIDAPFWMGVTEVTNRQFQRFDPGHDSGYIDRHNKDQSVRGYPANEPGQPVIRVTWEAAMAFSKWLSAETGQHVSLPSEAQWEWACRAGTDTDFSYGDLNTDFGPFANLADRSIRYLAVGGLRANRFEDFVPKDLRFDDGFTWVAPAGSYTANAWGLKDMHGNVAEWTCDRYLPYPYRSQNSHAEPPGASDRRVVRGGAWRDRPHRARSSFRLAYQAWQPVFNVGFRVVCTGQ